MIGVLIMTTIALILSIILVIIYDKTQEKQNQYLKYLPGYNCGACGFGSCKGMSEAMEKDIMNYKKCKPLRGEALQKMEEMVEEIISKKS